MMKERSIVATVVLFATTLLVLGLLMRVNLEIVPAQRYLFHALIIVGAALAGMLFAGSGVREGSGRVVGLGIALVALVLAMFLMVPAAYAYFEVHPFGHIAEHVGFAVLGFVIGFGLQRFAADTRWAAGLGWVAGIGILAVALLTIWTKGFAPAVNVVAAVAPATSSAVATPNLTRGAALFAKNCASCHGVAGAGGDSPAIMDERSRKSLAQLEEWIEKPASPMPALYPQTLSLQDVADIAGYIDNPAMSAMLKKHVTKNAMRSRM